MFWGCFGGSCSCPALRCCDSCVVVFAEGSEHVGSVIIGVAGVVYIGCFFGASLSGVASYGGALVVVSGEDLFAECGPVVG